MLIFFTALWRRIWPYVALVGAALAGLFAVRQSGKSAARTEDAARLNKQADAARQEARDVAQKIDAMDDRAVRDRANRWVRDDTRRD